MLRALILFSHMAVVASNRAPPLESLGSDRELPDMAVVSDRKTFGPLSCLRHPLSRRQRKASIAGALGLAMGWAITPTIVDPNPGRVATPEAWRRRIKAKYKVPLVQRSPRIFLIGLAWFTMAEFALALQDASADGSPRTALLQTTVAVIAADALARVAPRFEPLTSFVDARLRTRFYLPAPTRPAATTS